MPAMTLPGVSCTHGRPVPDVTSTQVVCTLCRSRIKPWFDPVEGLRYDPQAQKDFSNQNVKMSNVFSSPLKSYASL